MKYMLWLDTSKETLSEKINKAINFYQNKYGQPPTVCLVNPKEFEDLPAIKVVADQTIPKSHFFLGIT